MQENQNHYIVLYDNGRIQLHVLRLDAAIRTYSVVDCRCWPVAYKTITTDLAIAQASLDTLFAEGR